MSVCKQAMAARRRCRFDPRYSSQRNRDKAVLARRQAMQLERARDRGTRNRSKAK